MSRAIGIERGSRRARRGAGIAAVAIFAASAAHATAYDETTMGDLSGDFAHPTQLLVPNTMIVQPLTPGSNSIVGSTGPTDVKPVDNDLVSFKVPTGYQLSQIVLAPGSDIVIDPATMQADRMFFAIGQGVGIDLADTDIFDPATWTAQGLLGWTLVLGSQTGSDLLPSLGLSAPPFFPPIGGATGFSGPLGAGDYTLWMLDGDHIATYDLDLVVTAVPEPSTWALLAAGVGLIVAARRRRPARRVDGRQFFGRSAMPA